MKTRYLMLNSCCSRYGWRVMRESQDAAHILTAYNLIRQAVPDLSIAMVDVQEPQHLMQLVDSNLEGRHPMSPVMLEGLIRCLMIHLGSVGPQVQSATMDDLAEILPPKTRIVN